MTTAAAVPTPGQWTIDTVHSYIGWTVEHFGVARLHGRFTRFTGELVIDPDDVLQSRCSVTIDASSVESANADREDIVRSDRFLDVENHPEIGFVSSSIVAENDVSYLAGDFTMHGVTRPLTIPFRFGGYVRDRQGWRCGFVAEISLDRRDYGMDFDRALPDGTPAAGNEVSIRLDIEVVQPATD